MLLFWCRACDSALAHGAFFLAAGVLARVLAVDPGASRLSLGLKPSYFEGCQLPELGEEEFQRQGSHDFEEEVQAAFMSEVGLLGMHCSSARIDCPNNPNTHCRSQWVKPALRQTGRAAVRHHVYQKVSTVCPLMFVQDDGSDHGRDGTTSDDDALGRRFGKACGSGHVSDSEAVEAEVELKEMQEGNFDLDEDIVLAEDEDANDSGL